MLQDPRAMMKKWFFSATNTKFQQRIIPVELNGTLAMGWLF